MSEPDTQPPSAGDEATPAPPPARPGFGDEKKSERRFALAIALLTGVIGIGGTAIGAVFQANAADNTQEANFAEERIREDREHRAEVYFGFLESARKAAHLAFQLGVCTTNSWEAQPPQSCAKQAADYLSARNEFYTLRDQVFVYGSSQAVGAANAIDETLPGVTVRVEGGEPVGRFPYLSSVSFDEGYDNFLSVVCKEVPAQPRGNCGHGR